MPVSMNDVNKVVRINIQTCVIWEKLKQPIQISLLSTYPVSGLPYGFESFSRLLLSAFLDDKSLTIHTKKYAVYFFCTVYAVHVQFT